MQNITTKSWIKHPLSPFVHEHDGSLTLLSLFLLGTSAAVLHQHLRLGINIPGHHGLEWMTVLLFGRCLSQHRWAACAIAVGAASAYFAQSATMQLAHTAKPAIVYLLNGVCLDLLYRMTSKNLPTVFKAGWLGGVVFAIKPAVLVPVSMLLGLQFGSFDKHGHLYPVLTHFAFGSVGALAGIYLAMGLKAPSKN